MNKALCAKNFFAISRSRNGPRMLMSTAMSILSVKSTVAALWKIISIPPFSTIESMLLFGMSRLLRCPIISPAIGVIFMLAYRKNSSVSPPKFLLTRRSKIFEVNTSDSSLPLIVLPGFKRMSTYICSIPGSDLRTFFKKHLPNKTCNTSNHDVFPSVKGRDHFGEAFIFYSSGFTVNIRTIGSGMRATHHGRHQSCRRK